jgi:isopenicillin-N epimerase
MTSNRGLLDWNEVRNQFDLSDDYIHIGTSQFIASHPHHVHEAIERYRKELDKNPTNYIENNEKNYAQDVEKGLPDT